MGYYKIQSHAGTGLYLNLKTDGPIQRSTDVCVWQSGCPIDQIWSIATLGSNQQVKTINNLSFMLNANIVTWNCNVNTVNDDTSVNFEGVSSGIYYIRLVSDTKKYLTAGGTKDGDNVSWATLSNTASGKKAQQWKLIPTSLPTIYTRVLQGRIGLGQDQMEANVKYIYNYLSGKGYTKNAICGILGNMQSESSFNPAAWSILDTLTAAYGLLQWDDASNFIYWARDQGIISGATDKVLAAQVDALAYSNPKKLMDAELEYLTIRVNTTDWFRCSYYDRYNASTYLSAAQYKLSVLPAGDLARIFDGAYVRSDYTDSSAITLRATQAGTWYSFL